MAWNFDISQAPKGHWVEADATRKGQPVKVKTYKHVRIIAAGKCGVVTLSKWLPDSSRWEMFNEDSPPIAWMPWPDHPHSSALSSRRDEQTGEVASSPASPVPPTGEA